jgi:hypothetical protein
MVAFVACKGGGDASLRSGDAASTGTWSPTNQGPTKCAVFDLEINSGYLYAATYGRGIYRIQL